MRKDIDRIMKQIDREIEAEGIKSEFLFTTLSILSMVAFFFKWLFFGY